MTKRKKRIGKAGEMFHRLSYFYAQIIEMRSLFLILTFIMLAICPASSLAQQPAEKDSVAAVSIDTSSRDASPSSDDYSRYTRKGASDNLWKFSAALSLFLLVVVLMMLTKRKKK